MIERRRYLSLLTVSEMRTARSCPRQHHYRYDLGYRAIREAVALRFGSLVHLGLETWWRALAQWSGVTDDGPRVKGAEALEAALAAMGGDADPFVRARAEELLRGYHARYIGDPVTVLCVEAEFSAAMVNPATSAESRTFRLGGKIDLIIRNVIGDFVVEHKTSAEDITAGSDYWKRLRLDPQISTYVVGARALGYEPRGVLYDVIGKPTQMPRDVALEDADNAKIVHDAQGNRVRTKDGKKWRQTADSEAGYVLQTRPETVDEYRARVRAAIAEDPDRFYARGTVVRLEQDERDAAFDTWQTAALIRESRRAERYPRNPDACVKYGSTCAFFDVCCGDATLDDPTRFRLVENVHEELTSSATLPIAEKESDL